MTKTVISEELMDEILGVEVARAREEDYPSSLVQRAYEITRKRMEREPLKNPATFFRKVLNNLVLKTKRKRGRERIREIKKRFLEQSIVADLKRAGLSEEEIERKLRSEWDIRGE
jgi:DNA-directed RNA polymerase specialized sigma24 family protein